MHLLAMSYRWRWFAIIIIFICFMSREIKRTPYIHANSSDANLGGTSLVKYP